MKRFSVFSLESMPLIDIDLWSNPNECGGGKARHELL